MKETFSKYKSLIVGGVSILVLFFIIRNNRRPNIGGGGGNNQGNGDNDNNQVGNTELDTFESYTKQGAIDKIILNIQKSITKRCNMRLDSQQECSNIRQRTMDYYNNNLSDAFSRMTLEELNFFNKAVAGAGYYINIAKWVREAPQYDIQKLNDLSRKYSFNL